MSLLSQDSGPNEPRSQDGESKTPGKARSWLVGGIAAVGFGALIVLAILILNRLGELQEQMVDLKSTAEEATRRSESAEDRAIRAEEASLEAARGRAQAETDAAMAQDEAERAQGEAQEAKQQARLALEEAEKIKKEREAELDRLQEALNQIVDTRRTALGLVMNLGEGLLKFDFDKATLRPENKELLSRIVGILLTSADYQVYVYGHTDDVGTERYNLDLSQRRAQSVRDYLVEAGINPGIIDTEGFGKSQPLVPGKSSEARAKNRRVEIGIINSRITYPGTASRD